MFSSEWQQLLMLTIYCRSDNPLSMATFNRHEVEELFDEINAVAAALRTVTGGRKAARPLSLAGSTTLALLSQQPELTVPQIARQRGTSRQNMQTLVDRLADSALVEYVPNPYHHRSEGVRLTPGGQRALNKAQRHQAAARAQLLTNISKAEIQSCIALLRRIRDHIDGRKPARSSRLRTFHKQRIDRVRVIEPGAVVATEELAVEPPVDSHPPEELPVSLL